MYQIEVAAVKLDDSQLVTLKLESGNFLKKKKLKSLATSASASGEMRSHAFWTVAWWAVKKFVRFLVSSRA